MTFGLVARCDPGGLSTITQEVHRHLKPARTLLLDGGRGPCADHLYEGGDVVRLPLHAPLSAQTCDWICGAGDALFSAETFYDDRLLAAARHADIVSVMLAMPELAPWATTAYPNGAPRPDRVLLPTGWRQDTMPDAQVLPVPVARDRLPFSWRRRADHFYHLTGAAMEDRNGTDLLLAALPLMETDCRVTIRAERPVSVPDCRPKVTVLDSRPAEYWRAWPDDADVLVLPRRYGGLCLPVQEAASLGMPSIMLSRDPYAGLPFVASVETNGHTLARQGGMKGARNDSESPVPIWQADPEALARAMDEAVREPQKVAIASVEADRWADVHDWCGPLGDDWCAQLRADCGSIVG